MGSEKFPEAFHRYEQVVNTDDIETFHQLEMSFGSWAGHKWKQTGAQIRALEDEYNQELGGWYRHWKREPVFRSANYEKRINRYMAKHPHGKLSEARGHRKR